ncbi:MAG: hypothetical protein WCP30_13290, partial [Mycobacteriaceae bacterium]
MPARRDLAGRQAELAELTGRVGPHGSVAARRCRVDRNAWSGTAPTMLGGSVKHKPTTIRDRLGALWGLLTISDDDYDAYMRSYGELFVDSPENTRADYEAGVPLRGYPQGSSNELTELYKVIHLL